MPHRRPIELPVTAAGLRERANELRRMADTTRDEVIRHELLRLAETYVREAEALERRGGGAPSGGIKHEPYLAALFD